MMNDKLNYKKCTLCQACVNICPKKCITLELFNEEFNYPVIDKEKCINCDLCENVCPVLNPIEEVKPLKLIYAAMNLNEKERINSSSGGVFTSLANNIIENGGVVCGAAFNKNFYVNHIIIDNKEELRKLRGSKYVQSNTNGVFIEIKKQLLHNKQVLFSGCPCQVAGLKKFLGKEYDKLYTVDFICHGIPSQNTFNKYIELLQEKYKSNIIEFLFRDKTKGWHTFSVKVKFENGKEYINFATEDMYMRGFLTNIYCKPSCHSCEFRNFRSGSDITLADYWGSEIEEKNIDDNKGLSIVIVNSNKGKILKQNIENNVFFKDTDYNRAIQHNQSLLKSSPVNINREKFLTMAQSNRYHRGFNKFCKEKYHMIVMRKLRRRLGKIKNSIL